MSVILQKKNTHTCAVHWKGSQTGTDQYAVCAPLYPWFKVHISFPWSDITHWQVQLSHPNEHLESHYYVLFTFGVPRHVAQKSDIVATQ